MWLNPNWSKPPLRLWVIIIPHIFHLLGQCQGQGQGQRFQQPPPVGQPPSFQQGQAQFPPQPTSFQTGQNQFPQTAPFQPGQAQFPQTTPFQPGQAQFPQTTPFQPGQAQFPQLAQSSQGQAQFPQGGQFQGQFPPQPAPSQQGQGIPPQGFPQSPIRSPLPVSTPSGFLNESSFRDTNSPRTPIPVSFVMNFGSQVNTEQFSMFRIWYIMSDILPFIPNQAIDYIPSLQPQFIKGIPTFNISIALREPTKPQVLTALVTQATGMLISQKSIIAQTVAHKLGQPNVVATVLSMQNPSEIMSFFNPRLIQKDMPVLVQALSDFTASGFDLNLLKVKLLPPNILSALLRNLLGNDPLSVNVLRRNPGVISLTLMGVHCSHIQSLSHGDVVTFLDIYRNQFYANRKAVPNLNFPLNLRNCGLDAVLSHLATKTGPNEDNVLSRLDINEIRAIGGEFLSGVPIEGLENIPMEIRREILIEIGKLQNFDLLRLLPVNKLREYGTSLLNDLSTSSIQAQQTSGNGITDVGSPLMARDLFQLGNLFCYADILKGNSSTQTIRTLLQMKVAPGTKTCCLDGTAQAEWSAILKRVFGSDVSSWKSQELLVIGDLLVALSEDDVNKLSIAEIGRVITPLLENSGLNLPMHLRGRLQPMTFARACVKILPGPSSYIISFKALMRKYVLGAQVMVNFVKKIEPKMNARRVRREIPEWNQFTHHQHFIDPRFEQQRYETAQRYKRQSNTMQPPVVQNNRFQGQMNQPQGQMMNQPQGQMMSQPQDARQNAPMVTGSSPRLPATMASQLTKPVPITHQSGSPQPPMQGFPQQMQTQFPAQQQQAPFQGQVPAQQQQAPFQGQFPAQQQQAPFQGQVPAQQQQVAPNLQVRPVQTFAMNPQQQFPAVSQQGQQQFTAVSQQGQQQFPAVSQQGQQQFPAVSQQGQQFPVQAQTFPTNPQGQPLPGSNQNFQPQMGTQQFQGQIPQNTQQFQQVPTNQQGQAQNPGQMRQPIAEGPLASSAAPSLGNQASSNGGSGSGSGQATSKKDHLRSLPQDSDIQLTCLGIKTAGPAAIGLQISDFAKLEPNDLRDCIEAIGFVDWGEETKKELLLLYKQKLNLNSQPITTLNLIELGNLVTGLSMEGEASKANGLLDSSDLPGVQSKLHPFDIASINLKASHLDTLSILGTRITEPNMLRVIGDKFSRDNHLFNPKEGNSKHGAITATISSIGNIVCGLGDNVLRTVFDSISTLFLDVSPILGRLRGCSADTLTTLAHYAVQTPNYGPTETWTMEDVNAIGVVVAGLTPEALAAIPAISIQGLHPLAVVAFSAQQWQSITPAQLSNFTYDAANEILELENIPSGLTREQNRVLHSIVTVDRNHFKIPAAPVDPNAPADEKFARSIEAEGHKHENGTMKNATAGEPITDEDGVTLEIVVDPVDPKGRDDPKGHDELAKQAGSRSTTTTSTTTTTTERPSESEGADSASSSKRFNCSVNFLIPIFTLVSFGICR